MCAGGGPVEPDDCYFPSGEGPATKLDFFEADWRDVLPSKIKDKLAKRRTPKHYLLSSDLSGSCKLQLHTCLHDTHWCSDNWSSWNELTGDQPFSICPWTDKLPPPSNLLSSWLVPRDFRLHFPWRTDAKYGIDPLRWRNLENVFQIKPQQGARARRTNLSFLQVILGNHWCWSDHIN